MLTKYEQKLVERFKNNGGVISAERLNAAFVLIIRPMTTPGVDRDLIWSEFEVEVWTAIKNRHFSSPISGLAIFLQICDPAIYSPSDYITRRRKDGFISAGITIDYKLWNESTRVKRIELLRKNVVESIEKIPKKSLLAEDRAALLSAINKVAESLTTRENA